MWKYKHSLKKIEAFYIVALLNGTNCRFVDLPSYGQFFVSDPKGS